MAKFQYSKGFLFLLLSGLIGCGSDVPPGFVEGNPRDENEIYESDLMFYKTKRIYFNPHKKSLMIPKFFLATCMFILRIPLMLLHWNCQ